MKEFSGNLTLNQDHHIAIVVSEFNTSITENLLKGCVAGLNKVGTDNIDVYKVSGAFEIIGVAQKLSTMPQYDAVICLGAVIKGETDHYEYICNAVTSGITSVATHSPIPVIFGVLTVATIEQAMNRAGLKSGNKGYDCALTAAEMINLYAQIK
ncbi:6,7-dimethyl-8-ribityllumazine synthase [Ureaplasma ceti]|uniref:6,7-dimethyl-8-ribityllumazine synthase n=1 Tax=Ureaplasma ceti TaxID=3119530 RepID=A0ABP9U7T3_9BACT